MSLILSLITLSTNFLTLIPTLTFEHLQRVWHASRKRLPLWTPSSVPFWGLHMLWLWDYFSRLYADLIIIPSLTFTELTAVSMEHVRRVWYASRVRLTFRTPGFVPRLGDLIMLKFLRQVSPNLPCLFSTFHLEWRPLGTFSIVFEPTLYSYSNKTSNVNEKEISKNTTVTISLVYKAYQ